MKLVNNVLSNDQKIKIIKKATTLADDTPSFKIVAIEILKNFSGKRWVMDIKSLHDEMKKRWQATTHKKRKRGYRSYFSITLQNLHTNDHEKSYSILDYYWA